MRHIIKYNNFSNLLIQEKNMRGIHLTQVNMGYMREGFRLLGEDSFIEKMEHILDRRLKLQKPGPKGKDKQGDANT